MNLTGYLDLVVTVFIILLLGAMVVCSMMEGPKTTTACFDAGDQIICGKLLKAGTRGDSIQTPNATYGRVTNYWVIK